MKRSPGYGWWRRLSNAHRIEPSVLADDPLHGTRPAFALTAKESSDLHPAHTGGAPLSSRTKVTRDFRKGADQQRSRTGRGPGFDGEVPQRASPAR